MRPVAAIRLLVLVPFLAALALGVPLAHAQSGAVGTATAEDKAAASAKFGEAKAAFGAGSFDEALEKFRASYAIVASPNSHLMVVNTLVELQRYAEGYREAEAVVAEAEQAAAQDPKYNTTVEAARKSRDWLRGRVGLVTVQLPQVGPDAVLVVGQRAIERPQWSAPIAVEPGPTKVALTTSDGESSEQIEVTAGGEHTVALTAPVPAAPQPPPPEEQPAEGDDGFNPFDQSDDQRLVSYIAGGVGGAGLLMFAIFGGLHLSQHADLEDQCPNGQCPPELQDDADTGRSYQTGANVTLVIGLVGVAAGAAMFFTTDWFIGGDDSSEEATRAGMPQIGIGPGSVSVRGHF